MKYVLFTVTARISGLQLLNLRPAYKPSKICVRISDSRLAGRPKKTYNFRT